MVVRPALARQPREVVAYVKELERSIVAAHAELRDPPPSATAAEQRRVAARDILWRMVREIPERQ